MTSFTKTLLGVFDNVVSFSLHLLFCFFIVVIAGSFFLSGISFIYKVFGFICLLVYFVWMIISATDPKNVLVKYYDESEKLDNEFFIEQWEMEEHQSLDKNSKYW